MISLLEKYICHPISVNFTEIPNEMPNKDGLMKKFKADISPAVKEINELILSLSTDCSTSVRDINYNSPLSNIKVLTIRKINLLYIIFN